MKIKNKVNLELLEQQAVNSAIKNQWQEAIDYNLQILKIDKKNIDAYLRLAFAYFQSNQIKKAEEVYLKLKKLQPNNPLVQKQLEKIKILKEKNIKKISQSNLDPSIFVNVPGKTKTVFLVNPGQKDVLASLQIGQEVYLNVKKRKIEVRNDKKEYIGSLPDDISKRLIIFIKAQSEYQCFIKETDLRKVIVFLKEVKKGKKISRYTSFPVNKNIALDINNIKETEHQEEDEKINEYDLESLAELVDETSQIKEDLGTLQSEIDFEEEEE